MCTILCMNFLVPLWFGTSCYVIMGISIAFYGIIYQLNTNNSPGKLPDPACVPPSKVDFSTDKLPDPGVPHPVKLISIEGLHYTRYAVIRA